MSIRIEHQGTLPQSTRLKTPTQFRRVFKKGQKKVGRYFVVFHTPNSLSGPRLGLAVSRRVGKAVIRNSLKRLVRENFRQKKCKLGSRDIVFIARTKANSVNKTELNNDLNKLLGS